MAPDAAPNPDIPNDPAADQPPVVDPKQIPVIDEFFEEGKLPADEEAEADTEEEETPAPTPHLPGGYVRELQEEFEEQEEEGKIHPPED